MKLLVAVSLKMRTRLTEEQLEKLIDSSHGIKQCDTEEQKNRKRDKVCRNDRSVTLLALLICFPAVCQ